MRLVRLKPRKEAFGWRNKGVVGYVKGRLDRLENEVDVIVSPDRNAALKARRAEGLTYKQLAEEFGISAARAHAICRK